MARQFDVKLVGLAIMIVVVVLMFIFMLNPLNDISDPQKKASLVEEIIDKAMIQCYALEGSYPGNLDYLETYGIVLDDTSYYYFFEPIGSNVKPIVQVIPK